MAQPIARHAARVQRAQYALLADIRAFDALDGWARQGSSSCAHWLSWRIGLGLHAAREHVRVAQALGSLPEIDRAFSRGELSYAKVRAMTRVADVDNETLLIAQAKGTTGAEMERICSGFRDFCVKRDLADGDSTSVHGLAANASLEGTSTAGASGADGGAGAGAGAGAVAVGAAAGVVAGCAVAGAGGAVAVGAVAVGAGAVAGAGAGAVAVGAGAGAGAGAVAVGAVAGVVAGCAGAGAGAVVVGAGAVAGGAAGSAAAPRFLDGTPARRRLPYEELRWVRRRFMADGTVQIELRLLPDEAERVWEALHQTRSTLEAADRVADEERASDGEGRASDGEGGGSVETSGTASSPLSDLVSDARDAVAQGDSSGRISSPDVSAATSGAPSGLGDAGENVSAGTSTRSSRGAGRPNLADAAVTLSQATLSGATLSAATLSHAASDRGSSGGAERSLLFVHLKPRFMSNGDWEATLQDGTAVGGETLRRLACDTSIVAASLDERGTPLHLGRKKRTVSPTLMRALWMRDRHCRFPGCNHRRFVDAHHIKHWANGGETTLTNTVLLCSAYHLRLHEGAFSMRREERGFRFHDPDGRCIEDAPTLERVVSTAAAVGDEAMFDEPQNAMNSDLDPLESHQTHDGSGLMTRRLSPVKPELDGCVHALVRRRERLVHRSSAG